MAPLLAGFSGGAISTIALYPLDLIKVRLQVNESSLRANRLTATQTVRAVLRHAGISGLYQGLTPAVVGSSISWGGYFYFYEQFKRILKRTKYPQQTAVTLSTTTTTTTTCTMSSMDHFLLACAAGACMVALTNPIWLIKTRMQLQLTGQQQQQQLLPQNNAVTMKQPYRNMMDAARTIVRDEGILSLYKGAIPALLLTSHGGVQFVAYEYLKKHFHYARAKRIKGTKVMERFHLSIGYVTIGAIAKIIASTTTYPLQVVKSRLQQRSGEALELTSSGDVKVAKKVYIGFINTVQQIWVKEGISGFFKGCITNAVRVAPGAAITFLVYESVLDLLDYN